MRSNYKRLEPYIEFIDSRALDHDSILDLDSIRGISSISKDFIKTRANLVGVVADKYKVVESSCFAYNPNTARMGDKIPIALNQFDYPVLVSSIYPTFKIKDINELHPEYLMMWFRRPEFDRYARFMSHGSAREVFDIDEMNGIRLPIPSITKQKEIVKEYNVIQNRIALNQQLIQILEDTGQAIYKQWFVEFEFPDEKGKPYKSSGGEMVFNEELEKEIPKGWRMSTLGYVLEKKGYIRGPFGSALKVDDMQSSGIPVYEQQHILDEHRNFRYFISEEKYKQLKRFSVQQQDIVISCSGVNLGKLSTIKNSDSIGIINQALLILRVNTQIIDSTCIKYFLETEEGKRLLIQESGGSAQPNIAKREVIQLIPFLLPSKKTSNEISRILKIIDLKNENTRKSNDKLIQLRSLLLSKLATIEN